MHIWDVVFISEELWAEVPFGAARERLCHALISGLVHDSSSDAYEEGTELLTRLGPLKTQPLLAKQVRVEALTPSSSDGTAVIPIRWMPTGPAKGLFPEFDGNLELKADGPSRTRLELIGSYRPPLGRLGARLNELVLHRAAHATLRAMLDGLVSALVEPDIVSSPE